ncbi:hypothetical protein, partial [Marinitenerispora sediminis]
PTVGPSTVKEKNKKKNIKNSSPPLPSPRAEDAAGECGHAAGREDEAAPEAEEPPPPPPPPPPSGDEALRRAESLVDAAVGRWPSRHRAPGPRDRQRLSQRVLSELNNGGDEAVILDELTRDLADAGSAVRVVLGARTRTPGWGRPSDPRPPADAYTVTGPKPAWCGRCEERTRLVMAIRADGSEGMRRCPHCHPVPQLSHRTQEPEDSGLSAVAKAATRDVRALLARLRT